MLVLLPMLAVVDSSPSPPPSPSPSPRLLPALPVRVVRGSATGTAELECVRDPAQTTVGKGPYSTIAVQCCESDGKCRRSLDGSNDHCIAGHSGRGGVTPTTYAQAVARCEVHGLQLCKTSCASQGCGYDRNPVWTALPCDSRSDATVPAPTSAVLAQLTSRRLEALPSPEAEREDLPEDLLGSLAEESKPAPPDGGGRGGGGAPSGVDARTAAPAADALEREGLPDGGSNSDATSRLSAAELAAVAAGGAVVLIGLLALALFIGSRRKAQSAKPNVTIISGISHRGAAGNDTAVVDLEV